MNNSRTAFRFEIGAASTLDYYFPHGYITGSGPDTVSVGGVILHSLHVPYSAGITDMSVNIHEAVDATGVPLRTSGLSRREIEVTGAAGLNGSYCPRTATVVGVTLDNTNLRAAYKYSPAGGQTTELNITGLSILLQQGCIIEIASTAGPTKAVPFTIEVTPLRSGKAYNNEAVNQYVQSGSAS